MYRVRARAADGGEHRLSVSLMWLSAVDALAPLLAERPLGEYVRDQAEARWVHSLPLCRPLVRTGGDTELLTVVVPRARPATAPLPPCATWRAGAAGAADGVGGPLQDGYRARAADRGRWRVFSQSRMRWDPYDCRLERLSPRQLGACAAERDLRVLLVGDSHTRFLSLAIHALLDRAHVNASVHARFVMVEGYGLAHHHDTQRQFERSWNAAAVRVITEAIAGRPVRYSHVMFNFGHWDAQKLPLDAHLADWAMLVGSLAERVRAERAAGRAPPQLVWRTTQPYAHKRQVRAFTEYRTNAKIDIATARQLEALRAARDAFGVEVFAFDSHSIARPRYHEAVDTHHYLNLRKRSGLKVTDNWWCGAAVGTHGELAEADVAAIARAECPVLATAVNSVGVTDAMAFVATLCGPEADKGAAAPAKAGVAGRSRRALQAAPTAVVVA